MGDDKTKNIFADLLGLDSASYGPDHKKHVLELYKTYAQTVELVSDRRQKANSFFLSINTAVVVLIGYVQSVRDVDVAAPINYLVPSAGIVICYVWYRVLRSYGGLNRGKFDIILAIEDLLPVRPFKAEWIALDEGRNPKKYKPLGKLEALVPWVFLAIHFAVLSFAVHEKFLSKGGLLIVKCLN